MSSYIHYKMWVYYEFVFYRILTDIYSVVLLCPILNPLKDLYCMVLDKLIRIDRGLMPKLVYLSVTSEYPVC